MNLLAYGRTLSVQKLDNREEHVMFLDLLLLCSRMCQYELERIGVVYAFGCFANLKSGVKLEIDELLIQRDVGHYHIRESKQWAALKSTGPH